MKCLIWSDGKSQDFDVMMKFSGSAHAYVLSNITILKQAYV